MTAATDTAEEAYRVGQKVVYRAPHVRADQPGEEGVVTHATDRYVFVRYGNDTHAKATPPELLTPISRRSA